MKTIRLILALLVLSGVGFAACPSNVPSGVTSCYFADFVSGSDSNAGTSEAAPWKHLPGMTGCSGNCSSNIPTGGVGYILKGGSVWTNASLGWQWTWSGTNTSVPVYIGYDPSWNQGKVNAVIPTSSGAGCTSITVTISGGGGSGATATANFMSSGYLAGLLQHVTLTNAGSGYTSNPTVSFAGSSCTTLPTGIADIQRPIIDATGTTWNESNGAATYYGPIYFNASNYVVVDHLEMRGMLVDHTISSGSGTLYLVTTNNVTGAIFENIYLHNFGPNSISESGTPSFSGTGGMGVDQGGTGLVTVTNSYVDNYENEVTGSNCGWSDGGTPNYYAPPCGSSQGIAGASTVTNTVIHDSRGQLYSRAIDGNIFTGNTIWNTTNDCCEQHPDTLYFFGGGVIADNIIHDMGPLSAPGIYVETCRSNPCTIGNTTYVYNNVLWNTGWAALVFTSEFRTSSGTLSPTPHLYAWNNTIVPQSGYNCIEAIQFYGSAPTDGALFNLYNNHCVTTASPALTLNDPTDCTAPTNCGVWNGYTNPNGTTAQTAINAANVIMTNSAATTQGYTIGNQFAPTLSSNSTVTASGANLTLATPGCGTSGLSTLCSDILGNIRPTSGYWQEGAYVFTGVTNYSLTVSTAGTGAGTVTGTNCSSTSYASGTSVTCSATATSGTFTGWSGTGSASGCSGTGTCGPFSLTANSTVTATFTASAPPAASGGIVAGQIIKAVIK